MEPKWQETITNNYHQLLKLALFAEVLTGNTQNWVPASNLKSRKAWSQQEGHKQHSTQGEKTERTRGRREVKADL